MSVSTKLKTPRGSIGARTLNWGMLAILAVLIVIPAGLVILTGFLESPPRPGSDNWAVTLQNLQILTQPTVLNATWNSLGVAIGATILSLIMGGGLAILAARTNVPGRKFITLAGVMPLFLPGYVGALAWATLGSPVAGFFNVIAKDLGFDPFFNIYTMGGLVFVLGVFYAPYVYMLVFSAMSLMNPDLEEASLIHGASQSQTLFKTTIPLTMPAFAGAGLLVFVLTFENFPIAQALGTPGRVDTLPTVIYRLMNDYRGGEAATLAVVLVLVVLLITMIQNRSLAKRTYNTVGGKGFRDRRINLGPWRWVGFVLAVLYFLASIGRPLAALFLVAIRKSPFMYSFSDLAQPGAIDVFSPFAAAFSSPLIWKSIGNSALVSFSAAAIGTLLAFIAAYLVYRTNIRGGRLLEGVSMLPLAIPAIVMGMGVLWAWLVLPLPLYGTLAILIVAFIGVQMPQGFRAMASSIRAMSPDLEDAGVMLGASRVRSIRAVTAPLLKVGLVSTFVLLLILSMRELTVPLFLYNEQTMILSILIYDQYENAGALQQAAATSLIYCALMFIFAGIASKVGLRGTVAK